MRYFQTVAVKDRGYGGSWLEGALKDSVARDLFTERWSGPRRVLGPGGGVAVTVTGAMGARGSVRAVWGGGVDDGGISLYLDRRSSGRISCVTMQSYWLTAGRKADDITIHGSVNVQYGCIQRGHAGDLGPWLKHACGVKLTARVTDGRIAVRKSSNHAVSRCSMWAWS
jgi:hypothetical protein